MTTRARPLVSIGLPVHNGAAFLARALDSHLAQSYERLEFVVLDNGSTDETREICEEYAARDERIRFVRSEANRGAAWSHNEVFRLASGPLFRWAAHDDISAPTYVERCVDALEAHPEAVLARPQVVAIDEDDEVLELYPDAIDVTAPDAVARFREVLFPEYPCFEVHGLIRAPVLARTGRIGPFHSSDRVLICELALHGPFVRVGEPLLFSRQHAGRSVRRFPDAHARAAWFDPSVAERRFAFPGWRYVGANFAAIRRAPISMGARIRCAGLVARFCAQHPRLLAGDLRRALQRGPAAAGT